MEIELHQLELRYAALRIKEAGHRARLVASLAQHGQQTPVLVVAGDQESFVLVDGVSGGQNPPTQRRRPDPPGLT